LPKAPGDKAAAKAVAAAVDTTGLPKKKWYAELVLQDAYVRLTPRATRWHKYWNVEHSAHVSQGVARRWPRTQIKKKKGG
jgi:hypothetical protein